MIVSISPSFKEGVSYCAPWAFQTLTILSLCSQRILEGCQLIVGIPILSSIRNLQFWLELCSISRLPAATQLLEAFATAQNPDQMLSKWNISTIQQVAFPHRTQDTVTCHALYHSNSSAALMMRQQFHWR